MLGLSAEPKTFVDDLLKTLAFCCLHQPSHIAGRCHSIRFCRREDISSATIGSAEVVDFPSDKAAGDVMVVAKRFMADVQPYLVKAVVRESRCHEVAQALQMPAGCQERRAKSAHVVKSIKSFADPCLKFGEISVAAHAYLTGWLDGTLPQCPRKETYTFLSRRLFTFPRLPEPVLLPRRKMVLDLTPPVLAGDGYSSDEMESDVDDVAPVCWEAPQ